jgi:hypothetical protein
MFANRFVSVILLVVLFFAPLQILFSSPQEAEAAACGQGSSAVGLTWVSSGRTCRGFITQTGTTTFTVPTNWNNSANTVEAIGAGGGGYTTGGSFQAAGGAGGAYAKITNWASSTPGSSITVFVGSGGLGGSGGGDKNGLNGRDTFFNYISGNTSSCSNTVSLCAKGGEGADNQDDGDGTEGYATTTAGQAASSKGGLTRSGGDGGSSSNDGWGAGGGGGAAGPNGVGGFGGTAGIPGNPTDAGAGGGGNGGGTGGVFAPGSGNGSAGGNNSLGSGSGAGGTTGAPPTGGTAGSNGGGGGGGGFANAGENDGGDGAQGGAGIEWGTKGSGGGGGGGGRCEGSSGPPEIGGDGGDGGLYGGGGGGASNCASGSAGVAGDGAQGIIVVTYTMTGGLTIKKPPNNLGLIGRWTFDGNEITTSVVDSSGQGNNGGFVGGATSSAKVQGKLGQGLRFDGVDDYVNMGDINVMDALTKITVSAWIKASSNGANTGFGAILSKSDCSANGPFYMFVESSDTPHGLTFKFIDSVAAAHAVGDGDLGNIDDGSWHHVVGEYDGTDETVWVDGVQRGIIQPGVGLTLANTANKFEVGGDCNGSGNYYKGTIDDVRVYNRALSAQEILALSKTGLGKSVSSAVLSGTKLGAAGGLVGHWTFDGADVTDKVYDRSGNSNNGYYYNGATSSAKVMGKLGQALNFYGSNNFVSVAGTPITSTVRSYAAWIRPRTAGESNFGQIISTDVTGSSAGMSWSMCSGDAECSGLSNTMELFAFFSGTDGTWHTGANTITMNAWNHVAVVYDNSLTTNDPIFYVNGQLVATTETSQPTLTRSTDIAFTIGSYASNGNFAFDGLIDDVRVYTRALSPAEIKQLYKLGQITIRQ